MDYAEYLRDLKDRIKHVFFGEDSVTPKDHYDYLTDTHPTEDQYEKQRWLGILFPRYAEYLRSLSQDEYNQKIRELYDIDFDDITYPWLSHILSNNAEMTAGSGAWEYSRNIWKLYK